MELGMSSDPDYDDNPRLQIRDLTADVARLQSRVEALAEENEILQETTKKVDGYLGAIDAIVRKARRALNV